MAKIDPKFEFDMFRFLHRPLRMEDVKHDNFLEKYMSGMQAVWEQINAKVFTLAEINDPSTCSYEILKYLKSMVGFTDELNYITDKLSETDLRKVILLAVPLWKTKGLELGLRTIIRLFTGSDARIFNWFDYRMIVGEKAIGEEQLGEDAWLISLPGLVYRGTVGDVFLLIQFDDRTLKDGSRFQKQLQLFGPALFEVGGPIGQSNYYLTGHNWCIKSNYQDNVTYAKGMTFECYFRTGTLQNIPLIHNWDSSGKGIKLYIDTTTNEITYSLSDGRFTKTQTIPAGISLADGNWHHIAWAIDWRIGDVIVWPIPDRITSIWLDGTRILHEILSPSFNPGEVRSLGNIHIGAEHAYTAPRYDGDMDMIRLAGDARYDVDLVTITPPGVLYTEYQAEELDEFQIDVRVVDDGTLDRLQLKRIINLMRPVGERVNIVYIDFYDEFSGGKGKFTTQAGNSYVEKTDGIAYLKLQPEGVEHIDVTGCLEWTDYISQFRADIYAGTEFEVRWLVQDINNYYAFRVNSLTKRATLEVCVAGVRTPLAAPVKIDIATANPTLYYAFYIFTVSCFRDKDNGLTTIRAFLDQNRLFEVADPNFYKGTLGLHCPLGSTSWCSEVEMFQMPLEKDRINPQDKY